MCLIKAKRNKRNDEGLGIIVESLDIGGLAFATFLGTITFQAAKQTIEAALKHLLGILKHQ